MVYRFQPKGKPPVKKKKLNNDDSDEDSDDEEIDEDGANPEDVAEVLKYRKKIKDLQKAQLEHLNQGYYFLAKAFVIYRYKLVKN